MTWEITFQFDGYAMTYSVTTPDKSEALSIARGYLETECPGMKVKKTTIKSLNKQTL